MQISVVIPCHNARDTIGAALRSVAAQSLAPRQIIVVDDSSSDDSVARARASGVEFELVGVEARNAGAARNAGIARASGTWIALLDADDEWLPHHLETAAALLQAGEAVAYMANHRFRSAHGERSGSRHHLKISHAAMTGEQWVQLQPNGFHFGHSTVLYRRARVLEVGGFDETLARQEDLDLWLRVVQGRAWAYGADEAAIYRMDSPGSLTKDVRLCQSLYLQVWLKNRAAYPLAATDELIRESARLLMSLSFVDGPRAEFRAAWELAGPHLAPKFRRFYAFAPLARWPLQHLIRLKRWWTWRQAARRRLRALAAQQQQQQGDANA